MAKNPLVTEQIKAGEDFVREFSAHFPVSVAFWMNPADTEAWHLYVASPAVGGTDADQAYREVSKLLRTGQFPWLDWLQVTLIGANSDMAQHAMTIRNRYPAPLPTRIVDTSIGGLEIDEAYLYPPAPAAAVTN